MPDPTPPNANAAPIEIEHLVQIIKAEAARLQPEVRGESGISSPASSPPQAATPTPPQTATAPSTTLLRRIELALSDARQQTEGTLRWPERFSRFPFSLSQKLQDVLLRTHSFLFKKQKVINLDFLAAFNDITVLLRAQAEQQLSAQEQYEQLQQQYDEQLQQQRRQLQQQYEQLQQQYEQLQQQYDEQLQQQRRQLQQQYEQLQQQYEQLQQHVDDQAADCLVQSRHNTMQLTQSLDLRHQELTEWLTNLSAGQANVEGSVKFLADGQSQLQDWLNQLQNRQAQTEVTLQSLNDLSNGQTRLEQQQTALGERLLHETRHLRESLSQQFRLSNLLLENSNRQSEKEDDFQSLNSSTPGMKAALARASVPTSALAEHHLDAFYAAFEDKFRGSREDIAQRLHVYLPLLEEIRDDLTDMQVLDLGSGRGEWLELLQSSGYAATGVDSNQIMAERCRSRGLEVVEADALAYLAKQPDQSLDVITGFHIIEHLPFASLLSLFQESIRVLRPGGLVIFETPNSENILVGASSFYSDPTHQNPLVSSTVQFVAEFVGFESAKILNLHPFSEQHRLTGSALADRFSDYFYGPQDYAILARRGTSTRILGQIK